MQASAAWEPEFNYRIDPSGRLGSMVKPGRRCALPWGCCVAVEEVLQFLEILLQRIEQVALV
jgi:hypothetical protein